MPPYLAHGIIEPLPFVDIRREHDGATNRVGIGMTGSATIFSLPQLGRALKSAPLGPKVHNHGETLGIIGRACPQMLSSRERLHPSTGGTLAAEWNERIEGYRRRSDDPITTAIRATMVRPAA